MEEPGTPLSIDFRSYLRTFAFYIYNCSFENPFFSKPLPKYDLALQTRGNLFGQLFAVFINNLEVTRNGDLLSNPFAVHRAQERASLVLQKHLSGEYIITPPLLDSEIQIEGSREPWKDEVKKFALDFGLGVLEPAVLGDLDYLPETWDYEAIFAVFSNVLRIDRDGKAVNADWARHRAAQLIRPYIDRAYVVTPAFQGWEVELQ